MLISPALKLLFIHAPKTGGTSVRELLRQMDPHAIELRPHLRASDAQKLVWDWTRYYRFSICRHPCDTLVSHYCNILREPKHEYYGRVHGQGDHPVMDFATWLRWHTEQCQASACAWFMDAPLNAVLRFEHLENDLKRMLLRVPSIQSPLPMLARMNEGTNRRPSWMDYFSADDLQYVWENYQEDFRRFDYPDPRVVNFTPFGVPPGPGTGAAEPTAPQVS